MPQPSGYPSPSFNDPSTWKPQEPSSLLFSEGANFAGNSIGDIFYGITLVLFFQCLNALLVERKYRASGRTSLKLFLLGYILIMFGLATLFTAFNGHVQQLSYVDNRNFPGLGDIVPSGPAGYAFFVYSTWKEIVPNACFIVSNWLADVLLMYRCFIIYGQQRWIITFPALLFLASMAMGIMTLFQASQPNTNLWSKTTVHFGLPYFTIAVSLNVILTFLITGRICEHARQVRDALPGSASGSISLYERITTILIESCALYSITSLLFIGTYAANNAASNIFLPILSQAQVISPFLVILRAAKNGSIKESKASVGSDGKSTSVGPASIVFREASSNGNDHMIQFGGVSVSSAGNANVIREVKRDGAHSSKTYVPTDTNV